MLTGQPGTVIPIDGAANVRDLGGWPTGERGIVRRGVVYRSTRLNGVSDAGLASLTALELATIFDLRSTAERDAQPGRLPDGLTPVHLDVLADTEGNLTAAVADLPELLTQPGLVASMLEEDDVAHRMADAYRQIVGCPSALTSYGAMFAAIADARKRPTLFHCTTGKDRTGWGAAALLTLLGVSREDVFTDYLLTSTAVLPFTQPLYDTFASHGGDPDLLRPFLGVDAAYLTAAFDEMSRRFDTIDGYFTDGLGLGVDVIAALRSQLTVVPS